MATTVGQHGVAAFVNPQNGQTGDATVVLANDNTIRTAYVSHDADPGIHVQSSTTASRPAAGTAGRKWMTIDAGVVKLWYDNGSTWTEISYVQNTGVSTVDTLEVAHDTTLGTDDTDTLTVNAGVDSDLAPAVDNTVDLGTSTKSWRDVNVARDVNVGGDVNADGDANVGGTVIATGFTGSGANLTDLEPSAMTPGTFGGSGTYTFPQTASAASFSATSGVFSQGSTSNASGSVSVSAGGFFAREYILTGNTTLNFSNPTGTGASLQVIVVRQNVSGGNTLTWGSGIAQASGMSQTMTGGRASIYLVIVNGANAYVCQLPGELT